VLRSAEELRRGWCLKGWMGWRGGEKRGRRDGEGHEHAWVDGWPAGRLAYIGRQAGRQVGILLVEVRVGTSTRNQIRFLLARLRSGTRHSVYLSQLVW
jgi:hypothetical protein